MAHQVTRCNNNHNNSPLRPHCRAYAQGTVALRPVRSADRAPRDERQLGALIVDEGGRILLRQRGANERLGRLWGFPGGEIAWSGGVSSSDPPLGAAQKLAQLLRGQLGCEANVSEFFAQAPLRISGVRGWLFVYRVGLPAGYRPAGANIRWLDREARAQASFGRAERVILDAWEVGELPAPLPTEEAAQEED